MAAYIDPTVADFQAYFVRDFPYGNTQDTVMDSDITKAMAECKFLLNPSLFSDQNQYSIGFMYLTAHYLVMDLRMASQGIAGSYSWLSNSKAVGNVSESFSIPQRILDNPELAYLSKTNYGAKYLSLILPNLTAQVFVVRGRTLP